MNLLIALAIIGIIAVGAWDLRDGSLDLPSKFSIKKDKPSLSKEKNLPAKGIGPADTAPLLKFLKEKSSDQLDKLSANAYGSFLRQIKAKDLSFKVLSPSYLPPSFNFLKEESVKMAQGTNLGIPQINYLFESAGGKNGLALRQFDKASYQKIMTQALKKTSLDWPEFFQTQYKAKPLERGGQTIYIRIPAEKVRSIAGDRQFMASAHLVNDDSVIELNYLGDQAFSEDELIKIILALKPAR